MQENDFNFGKIKQCEAACREFGRYIEEFGKKRNNELNDFITRNINEKTYIEEKTKPLYETEHEVIYSESSFRVLKYNKRPESKEPLLIIPSLINKYYILDLMEDVSFVKYLRDSGVNVYIVDWGTPGVEHDHIELGTYIFKWIGRAVKKVLHDSGCDQLTLMGYCMGATMAAIYTAKHQDLIKGFISLAAPYDFTGEDSLTVMAKNLDVDKILEAYKGMSPDMMQFGFMLAQPSSSYFKMKSLYANGSNDKRNQTFIHLERWLNDNVPFPKEAYREYIKKLYQKNELYNGKLNLQGKDVCLDEIKVPVLNVIALKDNIVAKKAALALNEKVSSRKKSIIEVNAGHIGVIMGRKARQAWLEMYEWFKDLNK